MLCDGAARIELLHQGYGSWLSVHAPAPEASTLPRSAGGSWLRGRSEGDLEREGEHSRVDPREEG